jgi:hypothetical protein
MHFSTATQPVAVYAPLASRQPGRRTAPRQASKAGAADGLALFPELRREGATSQQPWCRRWAPHSDGRQAGAPGSGAWLPQQLISVAAALWASEGVVAGVEALLAEGGASSLRPPSSPGRWRAAAAQPAGAVASEGVSELLGQRRDAAVRPLAAAAGAPRRRRRCGAGRARPALTPAGLLPCPHRASSSTTSTRWWGATTPPRRTPTPLCTG